MSFTKDMSNPNLTPEQVAAREMLRAMVAGSIFCPVSGRILSNKTAVMVEATAPAHNVPTIVMDPSVWAEKGPACLAALAEIGATVTVTEGAD